MKKFCRVLFLLIGVGVVFYLVTAKKTETKQLWDEVLAKVPCCPDCGRTAH